MTDAQTQTDPNSKALDEALSELETEDFNGDIADGTDGDGVDNQNDDGDDGFNADEGDDGDPLAELDC